MRDTNSVQKYVILFMPLKTELHFNKTEINFLSHSKHTTLLLAVTLFKNTIAVYREDHTTYNDKYCGQNSELLKNLDA
jgi:hypothetical protein